MWSFRMTCFLKISYEKRCDAVLTFGEKFNYHVSCYLSNKNASFGGAHVCMIGVGLIGFYRVCILKRFESTCALYCNVCIPTRGSL